MIEVLRGSAARLHRAALERHRSLGSESTFHDRAPDSIVRWQLVRELVAAARDRFGAAHVQRVLEQHRPAVSLVLDGFEERLTPEERRIREHLAGRTTSHLSHNWAVRRPLLEQWANVLHALYAGARVTWIVPHAGYADDESIMVLRAMLRMHGSSMPGLILGFDPDIAPPLDEHGICPLRLNDDERRLMMAFLSAAGPHVHDVGRGDEPDPAGTTPPRDLWPQPFDETVALNGIRAASPDAAAVAFAVESVRAAFRSFAVNTSLQLGIELTRRDLPLDSASRAIVHGMIALSAHNRQFASNRNSRLAAFIREHLERALEHTTAREERCAIFYRLAVTAGRRLGNLPAALEWSNAAVAAAADPALSLCDRVYQGAWSRNIRAFVLMRMRDNAAAGRDGEEAFALMRDARESLIASGEWTRELDATQSLVAHNIAALALVDGASERFQYWHEVSSEIEAEHPGTERFDAMNWINVERRKLRADRALDHALGGLADARREADGALEYHHAMNAGDLSYRLGIPDAALDHFREARRLRGALLGSHRIFTADLTAAHTALRAGELEFAEQIATELLDGGTRPPMLTCEVLSVLGMIAARRGDSAAADEWFNRAISLAVESGEQAVLLRVAIAAGTACEILGRTDDAADAYRRGVEIANVPTENAPPAQDMLRALLHASSRPAEPSVVTMMVQLAPRALRDADVWWELPRLLEIVETAPEDSAVWSNPELRRPLEMLITAGLQRADSSSAAAALALRLKRAPPAH